MGSRDVDSDGDRADARTYRRRLFVARLTGLVALGVSGLFLWAWLVGWDGVLPLVPGFPSMEFNTALALALLGGSMVASARTGAHPAAPSRAARVTILCAGLAALTGVLTIVQMLSGTPLGIEEWLVRDASTRSAGAASAPGHMAPATATALLMLAVALAASPHARKSRIANALMHTGAIGAIALGATVGGFLVVSAVGLDTGPLFSTMAAHTAWLIVLLGIGVLLAQTAHRRAAPELAPDRPRAPWANSLGVLAILVLGVGATLVMARRAQNDAINTARARFDGFTERLLAEARRRLELPVYGLRGARGLYAASKSVERLEYRQYVASIDLARNFPGVLGMGFIQRVLRADLDAYVAAQHADDGPDFAVRTSGNADDLYVIKFIDPLSANRPAWGYDVGTDPTRRAAAERAVRTGEPVLTPRITLVQDDRNRPGFLYLVPVYRNGTNPKTAEERVAALDGLVYVAAIADGLFEGVVEVADRNLELEVFEGEQTTGATLIYDDDGRRGTNSREPGAPGRTGPRFQAAFPVHLGGRTLTVRASTTPAFERGMDAARPVLVTASGLLLSTLAAGLLWTLGRSHARAVRLAAGMTTDLRRATSQLEHTALTDRLTGLPNRALLLDRITQAMTSFQRDPQRRYAVLFLDFDRFKLINDTMGHDAGDQLLIKIAGRLCALLRPADTIALAAEGNTAARIGGDEFVVLLVDLVRDEDAQHVADRLVDAFAQPYEIAGQSVKSTASIGVVIGGPAYADAFEILRDADLAMYEAKAAGKGRSIVFDDAMRASAIRRAGLERDLIGAASRGEMTLHYQPIVHLESGRVERVEALIRWRHPTLGPIGPAEFIPIAEDSGQIVELGEWTLRQASAQARRWRTTMGPEHAPSVAVNLSRMQLARPDLADRLAAIVRHAGVEPQAMCLEITETTVMRHPEVAIEQLGRLRSAGFAIALDDFGTGQSSLASLHTLPLDIVKIDRAFVTQSALGRAHAAMVRAVVDLASSLGLIVVAEGVETPEQLATLQTLDCQYAQGYFLGKPGPAEAIGAVFTWRRDAA